MELINPFPFKYAVLIGIDIEMFYAYPTQPDEVISPCKYMICFSKFMLKGILLESAFPSRYFIAIVVTRKHEQILAHFLTVGPKQVSGGLKSKTVEFGTEFVKWYLHVI